jgi:hypothetical protein
VRPALIVIAKEPLPGRCKTRLAPQLSHDGAARLAEAALADTLAAAAGCDAGRRVLALDGRPGPWLPAGFELLHQRGDGLDQRLASAFVDVGDPALLIGMDTPQVTPALLSHALDRLSAPGVDAVLGPAVDGGYWAIGLHRPRRHFIEGVPMSTSGTFSAQLARLRHCDVRVELLPRLRDVDLIDDARAVARLAPRSRFAGTLAELVA